MHEKNKSKRRSSQNNLTWQKKYAASNSFRNNTRHQRITVLAASQWTIIVKIRVRQLPSRKIQRNCFNNDRNSKNSFNKYTAKVILTLKSKSN